MAKNLLTIDDLRKGNDYAPDLSRYLFVPTGSLDRFARRLGDNDIKNIFHLADSIGYGTGASDRYTKPWGQRARRLMQKKHGDGGYGFVPNWHESWSESGAAWTNNTSGTAGDKQLMGDLRGASNATQIRIWTKPASVTVNSFDIFFEDGLFSTAAPSYSLDGGSSWLAFPSGTFTQSATYQKCTVNSAITTDLRIRAATAAGSNVAAFIGGISVHTSATDAVRFHNIGFPANFLVTLCRTTLGDPFAHFDLVNPDLAIVGTYSNDMGFAFSPFGNGSNETAASIANGYGKNLDTIIQEVQGKNGDVVLVSPYVQNRYTLDAQAMIRETIFTKARQYNCAVLDLWSMFNNKLPDSQYLADGLHPSDLGASQIGTYLSRLLLSI